MTILYYLAYGSNLHPFRLSLRVPSAKFVGVVEWPGYQLAFQKVSKDGSGKCLFKANDLKSMYGALYALDFKEKPRLDRIEGSGSGYRETTVQFSLNGTTYTPFVYAATSEYIDTTLMPYHWYKQLVIAGARYHHFPADYIAEIEAVPSISDPDESRTHGYEEILRQMAMVN